MDREVHLAPDGGVQPVAGEQPAPPDPRTPDGGPALLDRAGPPGHDDRPQLPGSVGQRRVQDGPADPAPGGCREEVLGRPCATQVPDPGEGVSGGVDPEPGERGDGARHEALPARLVDRGRPWFDDDDGQAGEPPLDGRGEADRPTADDQEVGVGGHAGAGLPELTDRSARSSVGIRKPSRSTAFSTVNATAVTQAVCTRGRAAPSTATAT